MTWYAIYEIATGRLLSTGTVIDKSDAEFAAEGKAKKEYAESVQVPTKRWNEATRDFDTVVPPKLKISVKDFLDRFTPVERDGLFDAARSGSPSVKKALHAFLEYLKITEDVDLEDTYIIDRVNRMESAGLIDAGRAAEILA